MTIHCGDVVLSTRFDQRSIEALVGEKGQVVNGDVVIYAVLPTSVNFIYSDAPHGRQAIRPSLHCASAAMYIARKSTRLTKFGMLWILPQS